MDTLDISLNLFHVNKFYHIKQMFRIEVATATEAGDEHDADDDEIGHKECAFVGGQFFLDLHASMPMCNHMCITEMLGRRTAIHGIV